MATEPTPKTLAAKLAEVMAAVGSVAKRGRNDFHNYNYATEADIAAAIRQELAKRSVILIPGIVGESREAVGNKGEILTSLDMTMTYVDGDTGEQLERAWRGWGTDKLDKGGFKAITGAEKYFLLKTFLIPTGDDPEATSTGDRDQSAPQKPAQATVAAGTVPPGLYRVLSVVPVDGRKPARIEVCNSDGATREMKTFDVAMAGAADLYRKGETPVTVEWTKAAPKPKDKDDPSKGFWPADYFLDTITHVEVKTAILSERSDVADDMAKGATLGDNEAPEPPDVDLEDLPF